MLFGLTIEKLLMIGVIAAIVIGPERLPRAAEAFGRFVRTARDWAKDAKGRMKEEMGPEFDDVDWRKLDPRQYDPRRIVREALFDDQAVATKPVAAAAAAMSAPAVAGSAVTPQIETVVGGDAQSAAAPRARRFDTETTELPPFDTEAT